jgi:hypothetical protein
VRKKREYETHFEGETSYNSQRTYNKEHFTTNKVYNTIHMSVQKLIYTRIYTCTCNCIQTYVQLKYEYRIQSLTSIIISHSFPSTYRLYTSTEKVIHTELFQCYFKLFTVSEQPFNLKGETAIWFYPSKVNSLLTVRFATGLSTSCVFSFQLYETLSFVSDTYLYVLSDKCC